MRKIFLYTMILGSVIACKNSPSPKDEILRNFDSVSRRLDKLNNEFGANTQALYDSIALKYGNLFLGEFRDAVIDGKNYIKSLKAEFIVRCGGVGNNIPEDSYHNLDMATEFFIKEKKAENLFNKLAGLQKTFSSYNVDPLLDEKINKMILSPKREGATTFANGYFNMVPPVAAMTILSKFENDITVFEKEILKGILK